MYAAGDFTFLDGNATTVTQGVDGNGDPTITYESTDTVTRLKGGAAGTFTSGDVIIEGGTNVVASQTGGTITLASTDTDTITRIASGTNAVVAGDFKFVATGATSISQSTNAGVTTIEISSVNTDSGAAITASGGLQFSSSDSPQELLKYIKETTNELKNCCQHFFFQFLCFSSESIFN